MTSSEALVNHKPKFSKTTENKIQGPGLSVRAWDRTWGRLKQACLEFDASRGCTERHCFK